MPEQDGRPGQGMRHALSKNNVNALLPEKHLRHFETFLDLQTCNV